MSDVSYCVIILTGMLYLTSQAWEEAVKKEQAKVKELEEKFHTKILENGVGIWLAPRCTLVLQRYCKPRYDSYHDTVVTIRYVSWYTTGPHNGNLEQHMQFFHWKVNHE